ncbi:ACP S-malonyltransferase [Microbulbifer sp. 2205BS26-8]|uniref:ACP S-malonyltransferase n=1 Tax=Microbulbifer sp. 2205BS26-8 TaxID=3064386 RepID=UPI00273D3829|nr:acyltransferase domain-containing protein [Microbulbifer sp. 2205BS26-8]MDP5210199.1 acyltransferase domain-containing protein [Microbulbifer sp. 2205BS26-8]
MRCYLFAGQGTQKVGMGKGLFEQYQDLTESASEVLGYCIKSLCLLGSHEKLSDTLYAQPAIYTVNAFNYFNVLEEQGKPDIAMGHSLGEYNALHAAGVFDFIQGLMLVKKRAEAMAKANGGGMVAVVGMHLEKIRFLMKRSGLSSLEVANYNTVEQTVVAGRADEVSLFARIMDDSGAMMTKELDVSGAFHSSAMVPTTEAYRQEISSQEYAPLQFSVIANSTALPYEDQQVGTILAEQVISPVKWFDSIRYVLSLGDVEFVEIGESFHLSSMVRKIKMAV